MGFLDNERFNEVLQRFNAEKPLDVFYRYWREHLFEITEKMFTWHGLNFPQHEIESRLILFGMCGIIAPTEENAKILIAKKSPFFKNEKDLIACDVSLYGITEYYDMFKSFNFTTPVFSGRREIDIDGVLIQNNALRNPTIDLIHHYAILLAHVEVTLLNVLINGRIMQNIIAGTKSASESAKEFYTSLVNGKPSHFVDTSFIGLDFKDVSKTGQLSIQDIYDIRESLLTSFYSEIGVKKPFEKKERLITVEVESGEDVLRLNIKDMFDFRKKACEEINRLFNTNISVECNANIELEKGENEDETIGNINNNTSDGEHTETNTRELG